MNDRGEFVVTWSSKGQDGDGWGVYAQRFDASGRGAGGEFRVNSATGGDQTSPSVAIDAAGELRGHLVEQGPGRQEVVGRLRRGGSTPRGRRRGASSASTPPPTGDQADASVAMNDRGEFVVAWASKGQDGDGWGVYAAAVRRLGARLGGEFRVNSATGGDQTSPSVAIDASGNFVITWSSNGQDGEESGASTRSGSTPRGRRRGASSASTPPPTATSNTPRWRWTRAGTSSSPGRATRKAIRAGASTGANTWRTEAARGEEIRIETSSSKDQSHSTVAVDNYGHAVVVWSGQRGRRQERRVHATIRPHPHRPRGWDQRLLRARRAARPRP